MGVELATLGGFLLVVLALELTPGPNMSYLALLSLEKGRRAGLAAAAGVAVGLLVLGLIAGYGLGTTIIETRWLYETVRWAGVAFLVWLAWDSYRESRQPAARGDSAATLGGYFARGLANNLLNPKAALFYVTVLPSFVVADRPAGLQTLVLTLVYVAVATAIHLGVVLAASLLQPLLGSGRWRAGLGVVFALLLLAIAAWLAVATQRVW